MNKEILFSNKASKTFFTLPKNIKDIIRDKINLLATNPAALKNNIVKLRNRGNEYRLRVGDYRIIYTDSLEILEILDIGTRGGIY